MIKRDKTKEGCAMYDVALIEKQGTCGINKREMTSLFDLIDGEEAYPLEFAAREHESVAIGLIAPDAAEKMDYDYTILEAKIADILDDMELENESCEYEFCRLRIWLGREV